MVVHVYHQVNTINNPWHNDLYGNSRNANGIATINSPAIHSHAPRLSPCVTRHPSREWIRDGRSRLDVVDALDQERSIQTQSPLSSHNGQGIASDECVQVSTWIGFPYHHRTTV